MEINDIITGIIVPLVAAIIGGLLTFLGVVTTINRQKKIDEKKRRDQIRPWIFTKERATDDCSKIHLEESDFDRDIDIAHVHMFIWNSDNGLAIVDQVSSDRCVYKAKSFNIINKNSMAYVDFYLRSHKETLKDFQLVIRDIDGNPYTYKMKLENDYMMIDSLQ